MAVSGHCHVRRWVELMGREWALSCPPMAVFHVRRHAHLSFSRHAHLSFSNRPIGFPCGRRRLSISRRKDYSSERKAADSPDRDNLLTAAEVVKASLRRWYVFVPILAVIAWIAISDYRSVRPAYYANAVMGVAGSNQQVAFSPDGRPAPRNGLLDIGGADLIMSMVILGFDDPAVRSRVVEGGGQRNFTVRMFPPQTSTSAPIPLIMIEATESQPEAARKTVELAAAQTNSILSGIQRQAGVPESQFATAITASSPNPRMGIPARTKTLALMLLGGTATATAAAVAWDLIAAGLGRRRRRPDGPHAGA